WPATVTTTTTIYVDPPKRPKIKQKKEKKQAKKDIISNEENDGIDDENGLENGNQKKFDDDFRSEKDNVNVELKGDISRLTIDDDSDNDDELSSNLSFPLSSMPSTTPSSVSSSRAVSPKPSKMLESGKSVSKVVKELGLSPNDIIVVHDDMQRDLGKISIKNGGSANGHNGIKSVIDALKTNQFRRMRIGIGRPPKDIDDRSHDVISSYVLARITSKEMEYYTNEVFPKCKEQLLKI
ncbi:8516_t:CDS:2, partial [Cetraspora pellucida]